VLEGEVNHAIRAISGGSQLIEIIEGTTVDLSTSGSEGSG